MKEHREYRGERKHFTGRYFCHKLVYFETFERIKDAIAREKAIKNLSREKKIKLITAKNPNLHTYVL